MDHLLSREHGASAPIPPIWTHGRHHDSVVQVRKHPTHLTKSHIVLIIFWSLALADCRPVRREDMMSTRWMPWRCVPRKDGAPLRYAWGSRLQAVIPGSPNEATHRFGGTGLVPEGTRPTETSQ